MQIPESYNPQARDIAQALLGGFNKHYRLFSECNSRAKGLFENADWQGVQIAIRDRLQFFDQRVREIWQQAKLYYIALLSSHKQPELAETFFNSVFTRIFGRDYFNNDFIFLRPIISTEYIQSNPTVYRSYYPNTVGMFTALHQTIEDFAWKRPFAHLHKDLLLVLRCMKSMLGGRWPKADANLQIQVLSSAFYRNKAAYIFGKVINGYASYPFAIPVQHDADGQLYLDTVLLDPWRIGVLFSFSHANFLVDMEVPSGYVQFLRSMLPSRNKAELYTMLGLQKQGKNIFYRDFIHHLQHSNDQFIIAPGIPGMVMLVFTLPSYPYVFKLIKDVFGSSKEIDRKTVQAKYRLVQRHDRVGRLADSLEFANVAFPRARFSTELLEALRSLAPSMIDESGDEIVIRHLYFERRMQPLNLFLMSATSEEKDFAIQEYGNAIKELAKANIFPGDMLFKNFGVTRYNRVIFYDYDEIEYMTDCHFRVIPQAPNPEMEMSGEIWYPVARNDVFPEEFATFLLGDAEVRRCFMQYHRDLLDPLFWQQKQQAILDGKIEDFYPYPEAMRFANGFPQNGAE